MQEINAFFNTEGEPLYAWIHDRPLFVEFNTPTVHSPRMKLTEKKTLWVLHVRQLHTSYAFILL